MWLPPCLPRLSTTWGSATSDGLFLWPCAPVLPPLQLGVLSFPIGTPIDLGDCGPALPSEVVEHGAPNHRGAPRALHLLVGVEPRQEPFIEGDLGSPSRPRTLCGLSINIKYRHRLARGPRSRRLFDPVEPRRVPPHDQIALARRHVGELLGDRLARARPGRVAVRVVARPEDVLEARLVAQLHPGMVLDEGRVPLAVPVADASRTPGVGSKRRAACIPRGPWMWKESGSAVSSSALQ